jgi:hypothetical protein
VCNQVSHQIHLDIVGSIIGHIPDSLVKDTLEVSLRQSRALKVLVRLNLLGTSEGLLVRHWLHALLAQRLESRGVLPQIQLSADQDDGDVWGMMVDLRVPLSATVSPIPRRI